jgi:hypothetical protein
MMKQLGFRKEHKKKSETIQYFISKKIIEDLAKRFNIRLEEDGGDILSKTPETEKTPETLASLLEEAMRWAVSREKFTLEELASALGLSLEDTQKLVAIMLRDAKLVKFGNAYYRAI